MSGPSVSVVMRTFNCFTGAAPYDPTEVIKEILE